MPAKYAKICENERSHAYRIYDARHKNDPFGDSPKALVFRIFLFRIFSRISRAKFICFEFLAFLVFTRN